jgi:cytidylate kinase
VVRSKISWENKPAIIKIARQAKISFRFSRSGPQKIFLDGKDVTRAIRRPEISEAASRVAVIPEVRTAMVARQRALGRRGRLVAEGRDTGTVVFPHAPLKIYLTASAAERAKRRYEELKKAGHPLSYQEVLRQTRLRDRRDSSRAVSPLKPAKDAVLIDNSRLRPSEVFDTIESYIIN